MNDHFCTYTPRLVWGDWTRSGPLAERTARRVPVCWTCGRERPATRPRPPVGREVRAEVPETPPLGDPAGRRVAAALLRRSGGADQGEPIPTAGVLGRLGRQGIPASLAEEWLERFLRAGWIALRWRLGRRAPRLSGIVLLDRQALRELAAPGVEEKRFFALRSAREKAAGLTHPKAREIAALLEREEAESFPPRVLNLLGALAVHAEAGDVLAERVFSARYLGDSKVLGYLRRQIEKLVGPLAVLGIREGAAVTLLGGTGRLHLPEQTVDLAGLAPFAGLARETFERLQAVDFPVDPPPGGLLVVENLTAFEACCRGEVEGAGGSLVAWSAGYPGRAVRRLVERAASAGAPVRVWADLDLDGVRIARLVLSWAPGTAHPWRMSPDDLAAVPEGLPLSKEAAAAIRRDLADRQDAPLADTLRAILAAGRWVEQEALLATRWR